MKEGSEHDMDTRDDDNLHHDDGLNDDERLMRHMVGMSHRRKTSRVDPDDAWESFRRDVIAPERERKHHFGVLHMALASLCGAAAMLAVVLALGLLPGKSDVAGPSVTDDYIALSHKESPRHVSLETEGREDVLDVSGPISFVPEPEVVATTDRSDKYRKISTPRGMGVKIILPDSSEVWLNADSYIEFPERFRKGVRMVAVSGEVFFKITPDASSPFIVKSPQIDVRVLGTEFNFNNYTPDNTQVALVSGKVEILSPEGSGLATLSPGEAAVCDADGSVDVENVDTYALTQWVEGFFYFDEVPLIEVLRELGRWYNMGVVFHNREVMNKKVHFSAMRTEPVELAIESLNRLNIAEIKVVGHDIIVD